MDRRTAFQLMAASLLAVPALSAERQQLLAENLQGRPTGSPRPAGTLDADQHLLVTQLAEMILPETDTPGATSLKINEFIDLLLTESFLTSERQQFLTGLAAVDTRSRGMREVNFVKLAAADQVTLLKSLDETAQARADTLADTSKPKDLRDALATEASAEDAFGTVKTLTIYGYFNSKLVSQDILKKIIIPGSAHGCVNA